MLPLDLLDPNEEFYFENATVFGMPMIFTSFRINRSTLPKGLYAYDIMHDEEGHPCKLAPFVLVNHLGTVISVRPVKFPSDENWNRFINYSNESDFSFGSPTNLDKYREEHRNDKNKCW